MKPGYVEIAEVELERLRAIERERDTAQSTWGDEKLAVGTFSARRVAAARPCVFSTWHIDASGDGGWTGVVQVYGKANAHRIVQLLNADEALRTKGDAR